MKKEDATLEKLLLTVPKKERERIKSINGLNSDCWMVFRRRRII